MNKLIYSKMKKSIFTKIMAATVVAAMAAGFILIPAQCVSKASAAPEAVTDTCGCFKVPAAATCNDSIKIIEWQSKDSVKDCVKAATIYEDYCDNTSGASEYMAVGTVGGKERRIMLQFNFGEIIDSFCINPNLGRIAQFDSVRVTLYVDQECGQYLETGFIFRLGTINTNWSMDTTVGSDLDACATLKTGVETKGDTVATWCHSAKQFTPGTPRNWPLSAGYESVDFICHRPQPDNPPMKTTISGWITDSKSNHGWMITLDSSQIQPEKDYALVFYSSQYMRDPNLRPKLTMYFTKGENREDTPIDSCSRTYFVPAPR
jgi:hypothetical protein